MATSSKNNVSIKTYERDLSIYNNHIKKAFGTKDIHAVNLTDILTLTENLTNQGAIYTARRIIGQLNSIYSFVVLKQLTPNLYNPIPRNIRRTITHKETKYARIKIQELPKLMQDIDTANIEPMTHWLLSAGLYFCANWRTARHDMARNRPKRQSLANTSPPHEERFTPHRPTCPTSDRDTTRNQIFWL